jgi:hypothetical protein
VSNTPIELKPRYFASAICKVCKATDKAGEGLRDLLDFKKEQGTATRSIVDFVKDKYGLDMTQQNMDRHFRLHSPWIAEKTRDLRMAKMTNYLSRETVAHREAEEEIQKLVDIGGERVDKGDMPVDKDLYMFALDRQTRDRSPVSIQNLVMNFGEALINSKRRVIDGEVK